MQTEQAAFKPEAGKWYDGLTSEQYHGGPGLSSSELKIIADRSPLHFHTRKPKAQTEAMVFGEVLHALVLEPHTVEGRFIFAPSLALRTKAGKEAMAELEAEAASSGRKIIREDVDQLRRIADAVHRHGAWQKITGPSPVYERSFYFDYEGVLLKCRPDVLNMHYSEEHNRILITDLKSAADARDHKLQNQVVDLGYAFSAALYQWGVRAVTGCEVGWAWFVFEKEPPYATRVVFAGGEWLDYGRRHFRESMATLIECQKTGHWPGYDDGKAVVLDFPHWLKAKEAR